MIAARTVVVLTEGGRMSEIASGAADQDRFSGLQVRREKTAIGHEQRAQRAPLRGIGRIDRPDRFDVLGRNPHLFGP